MEYKDLIIPQIDVNDNKVTIENIRISNLDFVKLGEVLYTVSTAKSVEDYLCDYSGYIVFFVSDGGEVNIGNSVGMIFKDKVDAEKKFYEISQKEVTIPVNISKKAWEYSLEIGFDISLLKKEGLIKIKDIDDYIKNRSL
ncbi:MAG: hypothetical protein WCI71_05870 [Bacteroidota bacterium]